MRLARSLLHYSFRFFFFNDTATTEIYTLSLHDALPISVRADPDRVRAGGQVTAVDEPRAVDPAEDPGARFIDSNRSEEHTSELQSRLHLVCRLLLEKKKKQSGPCTTNYGVAASQPHC